MKKRKKKITKSKKKFFIIAACYVAVFLVTSITTVATLAWFNSSTWATDTIYMGGPVYLYFSDKDGVRKTSGAEQLVTHLPANWTRLYPGMNISFEATAVLEGGKWVHEEDTPDETIVYTTGAVLRARIMVEVVAPDGSNSQTEGVTGDVYNWIWPQLQAKASKVNATGGYWVFDEIDETVPENNYFYFVNSGQSHSTAGEYILAEVGGVETDTMVQFLKDAVITLPGIPLTNEHAECRINFTIVFHALQAFIPYEVEDIGTPYQGDTTGRLSEVVPGDVGRPKPLTIANSRRVFREATSDIYDGTTPS